MALLLKTDGTIKKVKLPKNQGKRLALLQKLVGGYLEIVYRNKHDLYLGNEEGRIFNLPTNPFLSARFCGDLVCVKTPEEFS